MLLAPRSEQRLLELARRVTGDDSLDDVERYRLRPLLGHGSAVVATACLIAGLVTGTGWFLFGFAGALVVGGFVDRKLMIAVGPQAAYVFTESLRGFGSDHRRLLPGDVEQLAARRWRVGDHELWVWTPPATQLLGRLAAPAA
jgi:hypothetical protein